MRFSHCWQASREEDDWLTNITVGTLDNAGEARVTRHIYADTQLPWYRICDDLPKLTEKDASLLLELLLQESNPESPAQ
jgi:hypothetical protein